MTTLHLISHTHWDREWYLTYQQFRMRLVHMVDDLLELLAADPNFRYFMLDGQTIVLDDYLQIRPEKEAELRSLVQEGRLLIGPWHILPDEFLVSPEATLRNLLEGERTARRFGGKMMVGYIPDPFGHIGQMPQILHGFGIDSAALRRGLADEPTELFWQAPDGSRVFLAYLRDGYDNAAGLPTSEPVRFVSEVKRLRDSLAPYSTSYLQSNGHASSQPERGASLLLMHGTDHMEAPRDTSAALASAAGRLDGDILVQSTLPAYLAEIRQSLDDEPLLTYIGELRASKRHHLLPGVLSTRMWIKQRNRGCETLLESWAEPFTAWAECISERNTDPSTSAFILHPSSLIHTAWRLLMENHTHDAICGCSIDQVHTEMRPRFDQVEQIGEEITRQSLSRLAANVNTISLASSTAKLLPEGSDEEIRDTEALGTKARFSVLVFNPTHSPSTGAVTVPFELPLHSVDFEILDDQGQVVPHQQQDAGSRELVHMTLDRKGLQDAMSMIHDGRAANMVVRGLQWERQGDTMQVQAIMATSGEPDLSAWRRALHESERVFSDDTLHTFVVQARTPPAAEATFVAQEVPACGYRTYWLRPIYEKTSGKFQDERPSRTAGILLSLSSRLEKITRPFITQIRTVPDLSKPVSSTSPEISGGAGTLTSPDYAEGVVRGKKPPYAIENETLRAEVSTEDGSVLLLDKRSGIEYRNLNRLVDGGDCGDEYNYCPPETDRLVRLAFVDSVRLDRGPVQQTIEVTMHMRLPAELAFDRKSRSKKTVVVPVFTRIALTQGVPRMDIETTVDNLGPDGAARARDHRLRVHFTAPFSVQSADYDGHFEIVRRKLGLPAYDQTWVEQPRPEKPQRLFTLVTGEACGLAIANRGLPEIEVFTNHEGNSEIALTLLRCVGWLSRDDFTSRRGHAGPSLPTPGAQMAGKHRFAYSIIPCPAGTPVSATYGQAAAFNASLRGLVEPLHPGALPVSASLVKAEPPEFALSAVKLSEDGNGWIARGYNLGDADLQVHLTPWKPFSRVELVTLSEETKAPLEGAPDGSVTFPARGHEIVTVKFYMNSTDI